MDKELRNKDGLTEAEFLEVYKKTEKKIYESPSVTTDVLLFTVDDNEVESNRKLPEKELKILLVKRKDHPYMGKWAFPGGFVSINENLEFGAFRELAEETNVKNVYLEQLYTWGDVDRDPRKRIISVGYMALVSKEELKKQNPIAGDDASEVAWFTIKKELVSSSEDENVWNLLLINKEKDITIGYLVVDRFEKNGVIKVSKPTITPLYWSKDQLAFDHYIGLNQAIDRLRNKLKYTDIAFNLVPKYFTLTQLQRTYECILGVKLTDANFRKEIKDKVVKTNKKNEPNDNNKFAYRPAILYRYKE